MTPSPVVAVVGAGVVGCAIALELRRRGARVHLYERDAPGAGCSAGNSGAISPGSVAPLALPGILGTVPGMMRDPESPLYLPMAYLPRAMPWLMRFVASARPARVAEAARVLDRWHRGAVALHERMTRELGVPELFLPRGHLHLYPDQAALAKDATGWRLREQYGYPVQRLDRAGIEALEPGVDARYQVGMFLPDHATIVDPRAYVEAMARAFVDAGGRLHTAAVSALLPASGRWRLNGEGLRGEEADAAERAGAADPSGRAWFDHVVIAAGAWSRRLLDSVGVPLPLETQRGYHVQFDGGRDLVSRTVVLADRKVFVTPMAMGLRVGGTVEIGGLARPPDPRRAAVLERIARASFRGLDGMACRSWMGHRPCMPDSLPRVGPAPGRPGLWLAVGHGHLGLTDSLATALAVADGITSSASRR